MRSRIFAWAKGGLRRRWCNANIPKRNLLRSRSLAAESKDFFGLLSIPKQYGVDLKTMEVNYKNLQKQFHPDQYATRPLEEQRAAETASSELNRAYAELRDPLRRARYMLECEGVDGESESEIMVDPSLLMQVMETREAIEVAQDQDELLRLQRENDSRYDAVVAKVEESFERGDLDSVRVQVSKLSYLDTIKKSIDPKVDVR